MEMVVVTKVTYKYLMNQSKHDLAQMVLDLLKKEEMQNNDLASVCRVSYHVFVDGVCAECGLTMRAADGAVCDLDHDMLALEGHSTCPNCGAIPPRR